VLRIWVPLFFITILSGCVANRVYLTHEELEQNSKIHIAVFPFANDYYGVTEKIIAEHLEYGYIVVERAEIYKIIDELKLQMSGITEYDMIKAGKLMNVDIIIIGMAYSEYKPYIPPTPTYQPPPQSPAEAFGQGLSAGIAQGIQERKSGTFIYASFRVIRVETGEVIRSLDNFFIRRQ